MTRIKVILYSNVFSTSSSFILSNMRGHRCTYILGWAIYEADLGPPCGYILGLPQGISPRPPTFEELLIRMSLFSQDVVFDDEMALYLYTARRFFIRYGFAMKNILVVYIHVPRGDSLTRFTYPIFHEADPCFWCSIDRPLAIVAPLESFFPLELLSLSSPVRCLFYPRLGSFAFVTFHPGSLVGSREPL